MKVVDHNVPGGSFEDLLSEAEDRAFSAWDTQFIDGIRSKFDEYGDAMYLSESQLEQVKRIAES